MKSFYQKTKSRDNNPEKVMTSYQQQKEGIEELPITSRIDNSIFPKIKNWTIFWSLNSLLVMLLLYGNSIVWILEKTGLVMAVLGAFFLAGSTIAGHRQIAAPALYVQGTGAIEDIKDAKNRAYNFVGPVTGAIVGGLLYLISLVLSVL